MIEVWPHIAILGFVTAQRLVELPIARANTARLLGLGNREARRAALALLDQQLAHPRGRAFPGPGPQGQNGKAA